MTAKNVLYVSDLDGTLLGTDHRISTASVTIINDLVAQGMMFTVATGRSLPPTELVLRGLDLRHPIICNNGALVFDPVHRRTLRLLGLDSATARRLVDDYLGRGLHPIVFTVDGEDQHHLYHLGIFNKVEEAYIRNRLELGDKRFRLVDDFTDAFEQQVMSLAVIDLRAPLTAAHDAHAGEDGIYQVLYGSDHSSEYSWLEVLNADANKGTALTFLREHLDVDRVVCFGDQANDVPMFVVADESYAMAGARAEMRALATGVIGTNDADAVAVHLRDAWAAPHA